MTDVEYCKKYSVDTGETYSSCGGYCCGDPTNQYCCYHGYTTSPWPAIGLAIAFGVIFAGVLTIVFVFVCKAVCCPEKTTVIKPEGEKKSRRYRHKQGKFSKEIPSNSSYINPIHSSYTSAASSNTYCSIPTVWDTSDRKSNTYSNITSIRDTANRKSNTYSSIPTNWDSTGRHSLYLNAVPSNSTYLKPIHTRSVSSKVTEPRSGEHSER